MLTMRAPASDTMEVSPAVVRTGSTKVSLTERASRSAQLFRLSASCASSGTESSTKSLTLYASTWAAFQAPASWSAVNFQSLLL